jgi:xanthine/uracil/vitamin C permease (AzgA family)
MVLKLSTSHVSAVIWVLIFGGMLMLALGLVVRRAEPGLGWGIASVSIAAIVAGAVLIWVRSRMKEEGDPK